VHKLLASFALLGIEPYWFDPLYIFMYMHKEEIV